MANRPKRSTKAIMKFLSALVCVLFFSYPQTAEADLVLSLSGINGSNVVNYEASGSVTVASSYGDVTSTLALGPGDGLTGNGVWSNMFRRNTGEFISNGVVNDAPYLDLVLSNGGVSYRVNGAEFGVLDTIDFFGATSFGDDYLALDPTSTTHYPTLAVGDVVSWSGSGTFSLEQRSFGLFFDAPYSSSVAIDGGSYVLNISAVPEPSSFILLAIGVCPYFRRQRNRQV